MLRRLSVLGVTLVELGVLAGVVLGRFDAESICYYVYIYDRGVALCSAVRVRTEPMLSGFQYARGTYRLHW